VTLDTNIFKGNTSDLCVKASATNVRLLQNRFTSAVTTEKSVSIVRWEDEFRDTASSWSAVDFGGDSKASIRIDAGFKVAHFGLSWLKLLCIANITSDVTTAIYPGYSGQRLRLTNVNTSTMTFAHGAGIRNIGAVNISLTYGQTVEYLYMNNNWLQVSAVLATSMP